MIGLPMRRIVGLGLQSLRLHPLRSSLTVLGIVFGVCSVIAMLAIGEGASQEAQEKIRQMGSHNVLVRSIKPPEDQSASATRSRVVEYGLTYDDAERIHDVLSTVDVVVPSREIRMDIRFREMSVFGVVMGTLPWYVEVANLTVSRGRYLTMFDIRSNMNVCVLGAGIVKELFVAADPLGQIVKVGTSPYRVVGVMAPKKAVGGEGEGGVRDFNLDMYIPISSAKTRFGETIIKIRSGSFDLEKIQLHGITLKVDALEHVVSAAAVAEDLLARFHKENDYEIIVPLELLRQAEETKRIFNIVLGSIAAISLLVGGIGIMNIMLATVTERTREIGIRRALGAKQKDIVFQFLSESIILSGFGGLVGLGLGICIPVAVTAFADMTTIITPWSLFISLFISVGVGIVFGIYPANRAARMDPIEALRHE